mmetsp:Transcript_70920/g.167181  ORF Transcript_70920/g.167181 Transcript_70920/m.167181 type:complete len:250 (+) Transcript_70920:564-1313(+)
MVQKHPTSFPAKWFSLDQWFWAVSVVWSRAISVHRGLVPVLDLLNHSPWGQVTVLTSKDHSDGVQRDVALTSTGLYKGEKILACYGAKGNRELVLHYGFTLTPNPHDAIPIHLERSHNFVNGDALLHMQGLRPSSTFLLVGGHVTSSLVSRVMLSMHTASKHTPLDHLVWIFDQPERNATLWRQALAYIEVYCRDRATLYPKPQNKPCHSKRACMSNAVLDGERSLFLATAETAKQLRTNTHSEDFNPF